MVAPRDNAQNSSATAKPRGRPFQKGQSGNPGGRPPIDPDVKAILKAATPHAVARLVSLIDSPDEAIALKACAEIINRELGKAVERHEHEVTMAGQADRLRAARAMAANK